MVDSRDVDGGNGGRALRLQLDEFALQASVEEAARLDVSVEELATFALLYYLADLDSGRIARAIPTSQSRHR